MSHSRIGLLDSQQPEYNSQCGKTGCCDKKLTKSKKPLQVSIYAVHLQFGDLLGVQIAHSRVAQPAQIIRVYTVNV